MPPVFCVSGTLSARALSTGLGRACVINLHRPRAKRSPRVICVATHAEKIQERRKAATEATAAADEDKGEAKHQHLNGNQNENLVKLRIARRPI